MGALILHDGVRSQRYVSPVQTHITVLIESDPASAGVAEHFRPTPKMRHSNPTAYSRPESRRVAIS
jgi:hypothetical protein